MRYFVNYLIYAAVLARAAAWSQDSWSIPAPIWPLLGLFGLLLFTERVVSRRFQGYPRGYTLVQSLLVVGMLYISPRLDILPMLFLPLSFQAVEFFPGRIGFIWIGLYSLAMVGLIFVGLEKEAGTTMLLTSTGANLLMGSFARLTKRTEQARQENQRLYGDLQAAYRQLKDSADKTEALAASEERHRLVRELHDSLTQTLFSMNLAVQAAQLGMGEAPEQVEQHLTRLQSLTRNAAGEVQALTGQGLSSQLAQEGLMKALQQLVEQRLVQDDLEVRLEINGERIFPATVQVNLYRIVQEALNNVMRHAGVNQAVIRLQLDEALASLEIEDTGCGFDLQSTGERQGFGLGGMAERAREIGWQLEITSQPGQGTRIRVEERAG